MKKRILITGANGLLGQKLLHLFLRKTDKFEVYASGRGENRTSLDEVNFKYIQLDITNQTEVNDVWQNVKPDFVIHTAAMTNVDQCETEQELCQAQNVDAVAYIAKACEKHHTFLLHLSTDFIFDGTHGPLDENAVPNPLSIYGHSKLDAEKIVSQATCAWAIARTVLVFGITPGMSRSNIILWVKQSLEQGKKINVVNDQWRTPTLAEDLAMGCYLIVKKRATGFFNISGYEMLTPHQMAIQTADFFHLDKSLINEVDGSLFKQAAVRPPKTGFIIDKARKELNYHPKSFQEGIAVLASQI